MFGKPVVVGPVVGHHGYRQERLQALTDAYWACAWPTTPVRRGEGLVKIHVNDVEPHVPGAHLTQDRI